MLRSEPVQKTGITLFPITRGGTRSSAGRREDENRGGELGALWGGESLRKGRQVRALRGGGQGRKGGNVGQRGSSQRQSEVKLGQGKVKWKQK